MRIGEVAAATGVSTRALRYYEEQQLLSSVRSAGGQRHYPAAVVERVRLIQSLYAAGLSSKVIAGILPCVNTGFATPEMMTLLTAERERLNTQLRELSRTRDRLDEIIAATRVDASG